MSNPTVSIAIVADAARAQAAFRDTGRSAQSMGDTVKHSTKSVEDFAESAGDGASRSSQLAGALGDLAGAFTNNNGKAGIAGKAVGDFAAKLEAAAPFVMVATGLFDLSEIALRTLTISNIQAAASFVATKAAMIGSAVATGAATAAQYALNLALSLNPIGIIIIAVIALIAAIVLLVKNWDTVSAALGKVWDFLKSAWQATVDFISGGIDSLIGFFSGLPDRVLGFLSGLVDKITGFGRNIVAGLINGVLDAIPGLRGVFTSIANALPDFIARPLGIKSPSRVFARLGRFMGQGLQKGFQSFTAKDITGNLATNLARTDFSAGTITGAFSGSAARSNTVMVNVSGGISTAPEIGRAVVEAVNAHGRQTGVQYLVGGTS